MKSRSLNFKIGSVITVLILGSVSIAYIGLSKMHHMDEIISEMVTHTVARAMLAKDVRSLVDAQAIDQRNILLAETPDEAAPYIKKIETRHDEILKDMNAFLAMSKLPKEDLMNQVQAEYLSWYKADHQVIDLALKGHHKEAMAVSKDITLPLRMKMDEEIVDMVHEQEILLEKEKAEADADYAKAKRLVLVFSAVSILLGILFAVAVLRSLSKLIQGVISDLNGGSEQVTEASQQIAEASVQLSHASTEQASSLEETVAAVEELTSVVKLNSDHAKQASLLAEEARSIAMNGDTKIHGLMSSMNAIADDSKKIEEIISVIEGIAFQTNLLALNAAVEAARAGEQGKGFAVVADAVRTLSQRTTSASKDISTLIRASVEKVTLGESQAKESGEVLGQVLVAIKKVSELNNEIAAANAEQSNGISQISQAMNQLDQATQINAATSEEAAASAEELSAQAVQMRNVVKLLNKAINGEGRQLNASPVHAPVASGQSGPANVMAFKPKTKTMADFESPQWGGRKVSNTEGF